MIVCDASVLCGFLLGRPAAVDAVREEVKRREPGAWLHAPELIEPEVLSALRRLERRGEITAERAERAVADFDAVRLRVYPHAPLRRYVWALRHNLTCYDACYLALTVTLLRPSERQLTSTGLAVTLRLEDQPVLMTADHGLAEAAASVLDARLVHAVGAESLPAAGPRPPSR